MNELKNPFDVVKATDLSDQQIADFFVDIGGHGLVSRIKPTSRMPMIVFGGKGSGKTHLMRYLSSPLQVHRHKSDAKGIPAGVKEDGYLGIYMRCGGLNAQRFSGKGQSPEAWQDVFAYYMDVWTGQLVLKTIRDIYGKSDPTFSGVDAEIARQVVQLFDEAPASAAQASSVELVLDMLAREQRGIDVAVNNCALTRSLPVRVLSTRGSFVFGIPRILATCLPQLREVLFLYLLDEFENLTEGQQEYVNTLVRERQDPCSFKVGVRLYGLRTLRTLSAGEENREDSEFEALRLDSELRERKEEHQSSFAVALVRKRLVESGYLASDQEVDVSTFFEEADDSRLLEIEGRSIAEKYEGREPPYLAVLRKKLEEGLRSRSAPGVHAPDDVNTILADLRCGGYPFVERTGVFAFYRAWAKKANLLEAAADLKISATEFIAGRPGTQHQQVLSHFRADVLAQLYRDSDLKQRYLGFSTFVRMSAGLPRCLLTILKHVHTWSLFFGESPFVSGRISAAAQAEAVQAAADWFFTDARAPGEIGRRIRDGMTRLGQLLRTLRYSDKPAECSLSTFSADLSHASDCARQVVEGAEQWSMIVKIAGGQRERNTGRVDAKYQVHPMLAPRWDLPIARRGAIALSADEVAAVFAPSTDREFDEILKRRTARTNAPHFFAAAQRSGGSQQGLPGVGDE